MTHSAPLSEVVGKALEDTGLSDRQLEARTGISRATLRRRLADGDKFTLGELHRLASLLGLKTSELVARAEDAA